MEVVPPFRTEFSPDEIDYATDATRNILTSGRLVLGKYTEAFESEMADVAQTEHAIAVSSGAVALEIAYKALDVRGRKVLIPSNTNFATAAAAVYAGAQVEFYDSDLYPDVDDLSRRLTDDVAAVTVVHIGGYITPEMQRIADMCDTHGAALVEDAAHAHGAQLGGRAAGSFGHAGAFSFFPTKTLTTSEGGMITTADPKLAETARKYRDQGKHADGITHEVWGNGWRMPEMSAALGSAQIPALERDNQRRTAITAQYAEELSATPLIFPELDDVTLAGYKAIAVLPEGVSRVELKEKLKQKGILLGKEVYEKPLHQQPVFKEYVNQADTYPLAETFAQRHICLPLWRFIKDEDVSRVVTAVKQVL